MDAVSRTGGGSYILGNILNVVTRSQYGRRLPQNLTRDVRPARTLVGPVGSCAPPILYHIIPLTLGRTVDPAARQNVELTIAKGREKLASCAEEGRRLAELDREIKKEQSAHKEASVSPRLCTHASRLTQPNTPDRKK